MWNRTIGFQAHPDPLPQERENRPQSRLMSCVWTNRTVSYNPPKICLLFTLPAGEGQGEGARQN